MQPLDARKVFPGFDEPMLKATFLISIECHQEFTALSNMDEIKIKETESGWKKTEFDTTPLMSTYILVRILK